MECPTSNDDSGRFRACEQANDGSRPFLQIISEGMASGVSGFRDSEDVLGIALVASAYVVYSRVQERAGVWGFPEYVIVGRTMAHELGHLLLGENSHSASGLMSVRFGRSDLPSESAQFLFDPKQAASLRKVLRSGKD